MRRRCLLRGVAAANTQAHTALRSHWMVADVFGATGTLAPFAAGWAFPVHAGTLRVQSEGFGNEHHIPVHSLRVNGGLRVCN